MRRILLFFPLILAVSPVAGQAQSPAPESPTPSPVPAAREKPDAGELKRINVLLSAFSAPELCGGEFPGAVIESYRLLWDRAFHPPVLATVTLEGSGVVIATHAQLGSDPRNGKVSRIERTWVDVCAEHAADAGFCEDFASVLHDGASEYLWSAPYGEPPFIGLDGSDWILEGRTSTSCHVIKRWSPNTDSELFQFLYSILTATGKRPYFDEVY